MKVFQKGSWPMDQLEREPDSFPRLMHKLSVSAPVSVQDNTLRYGQRTNISPV